MPFGFAMSQIDLVLSCVKKALKQRGISYAMLARQLDLSEASVKRLFSQKQFSMQRLEQICQLMQLELTDLLQLMNEQQQRKDQLSIEQEFFQARFNSDAECLLVLNGMLSARANTEFQRKLKRLANEFNELNRQDAALPLAQRNGVSVVLALRDWRFGLFKPLLKPQSTE